MVIRRPGVLELVYICFERLFLLGRSSQLEHHVLQRQIGGSGTAVVGRIRFRPQITGKSDQIGIADRLGDQRTGLRYCPRNSLKTRASRKENRAAQHPTQPAPHARSFRLQPHLWISTFGAAKRYAHSHGANQAPPSSYPHIAPRDMLAPSCERITAMHLAMHTTFAASRKEPLADVLE